MKLFGLAIFFVTAAVAPCIAEQSFAGRWSGVAHIENVWGYGRTFRVALDIHPNGSVSGTVGKATLIDGRFRRWRPTSVDRKASGDMMDYMITGELRGFIVPAEQLTAKQIYIPIDVAGRTLDAGVNAHGTIRGGHQMNIMSCDLTLRKYR